MDMGARLEMPLRTCASEPACSEGTPGAVLVHIMLPSPHACIRPILHPKRFGHSFRKKWAALSYSKEVIDIKAYPGPTVVFLVVPSGCVSDGLMCPPCTYVGNCLSCLI